MADSVLRDKSKEFAKQIVLLCKTIKQEHRESVLTNQLLRSGTSITLKNAVFKSYILKRTVM